MGSTDLQQLVIACHKAADHYQQHPTHAGPATVVDIYRVLASLAAVIDSMAVPVHGQLH